MNLEQATRACWGDVADRLLDSQAIVPVSVDKKPTVPHWRDGVDPFGDYRFDGLAVVNGARTGITAVDVDEQSLTPPVSFNVQTSKGGHIYVPFGGERRKVRLAPGVDLLAEGGYSIFYGTGKKFISPGLADPDVVYGWLSSLTPTCMDWTEGINGGSLQIECKDGVYATYRAELAEKGYRLEVETIMRGYVSQLRGTPPGQRNSRLFRLAIEVVRVGGDLERLAEAASESGLDWDEIQATVQSAMFSFEADPRPHQSVLGRVERWLDHYSYLDALKPILEYVGIRAVETNSLRPLVSQSKAEEAINVKQYAISRGLAKLETPLGAVRKKANPGRQANGMSHCNNYELTISGIPLDRALP
jgi:hypothetical protein